MVLLWFEIIMGDSLRMLSTLNDMNYTSCHVQELMD